MTFSGIGLETARVLRSAGADVVVPARDTDRARAVLRNVDGVEVEQMDLLDPASIDAFADKFLASGRRLHILVNSAGVMATPLTRDARGYEGQFATNHLGHFQLVSRLWPALVAAGGARVVAVSSRGSASPRRLRRPALRAPDVRAVRRLRSVEDRERPLRGRAGPAWAGGGRAGLRRAPGHHHRHRSRQAHLRGDDPGGGCRGRGGPPRTRPLPPAQDDRAGSGHQRLVRDQPAAGRAGRRLLRELRHQPAGGPGGRGRLAGRGGGRRRTRVRGIPGRPPVCGR
ncbi:SDR family NAD(P)-dependent oxidoreductase [Streptomyces chiangmaiensis]